MYLTEAQRALCRKLDADYTTVSGGTHDLFNLDDINEYLNLASLRVGDFCDWIILEEKDTSLSTSASTETYNYPTTMRYDSVRILRVADEDGDMKVYRKLRFKDYLKYREDYEEGEEKVFGDFRGTLYINPYAFDNAASRSIELYGKRRVVKLSNDSDLLMFSADSDDDENSGNQAVVELAYSIALASDKKKMYKEAELAEKKAYMILETLSQREKELRSEAHPEETPMFDVPKLF